MDLSLEHLRRTERSDLLPLIVRVRKPDMGACHDTARISRATRLGVMSDEGAHVQESAAL